MVERNSNGGYYTPTQAAHILRLTPTRVRQLLQSGELKGERDEAGHWTIPASVVHERLERLRRESFLEAVGYDPSSGPEMRDLVDELRRQNEHLRAEVEAWREEARRKDHLLAAALERIPQAIEPPEAPTADAETSEGRETRSGPGEAHGAAETPSGATEEQKPEERRLAVSRWEIWFLIALSALALLAASALAVNYLTSG